MTSQLPVFHRILEEGRQFPLASGAGRQFGDPVLGQCALDQSRYVLPVIAQCRQPAGHFEPLHELDQAVGQHGAGIGIGCRRHIGAQDFGGGQVSLWTRRGTVPILLVLAVSSN